MPRTTATPDAIPHSVLPTLLDCCIPTARGEHDDFRDPLYMYPSLLESIKGGGGLPLMGMVTYTRDHRHTLSTTEHSPQPIPLLAETWEPPSLSHLACTPYYKHSGCKIIQCPRTPSCWTYGPAAGTRINPCVTVLPLASTSGTRKHAALRVGSGPPGQDTDRLTADI